jgi:hypothetical protein
MEAQLLRREVQQQRGLTDDRIDEIGRRLDELSQDIAQRIDQLTASLLRDQ